MSTSRRERYVAICLLSACWILDGRPAGAAVTVYTDRAAWEAAVTCPVTEDFEQDVVANTDAPFVSLGGTRLTSVSGAAVTIQVFDNGLANGSRELHFRDFTAGVRFKLPIAATAFGFDYDTAIESWTVSADGQTTNLPSDTNGFVGYVSDSGSLSEFVLTGAAGAQGGISVDNLSSGGGAEVRRGGRIDELALPFDPAFRSGRLDAILPAGSAWKPYDDPQIDRFLGQSFAGLPAGIVRAQLVLRMRPGGGGSFNDALSIGINPGGQVAYSRRIDQLPGADNTWTNNPATTFVLDLAALPGGANLLPKLVADRFLDFYVQDDTTVDYSELRVWTCPPRKVFSGLPNFELGDIRLDVEPATGFLTGTDIGPGGGLGIDTGDADGVCVGFAQALCLGVGTAFELATSGAAGNETWEAHLTFVQNPVTGLIDLKADFSPNPAPCTWVQVCDEGPPLVSNPSQCIDTGLVLASLPPGACIKEVDWIQFNDVDSGFSILFDPDVSVMLPDGQTQTGNRVKVYPDFLVPVRRRLERFEVRPSGFASFTVAAEPVQALGYFQRALGNAVLRAAEDSLTAARLGAAGEDGVSVMVADVEGVDIDLAPIDALGPAADGAFLNAEAIGLFNGQPGQPLGELRVTKAGGQFVVTADFQEISSPTQRVQVLRGGAVVADVTGHTGVAATASAWPKGVGKLFPVNQTKCYRGDWPDGTVFTIDGVPHVGDELRVLAEGPAGDVGAISELRLRAAGIPELTLTDVRTKTTCTAGPTQLCLNGGRFRIEVEWTSPAGDSGFGQAVPLTDDTGFFWFFGPDNVEMVIKVLNGCPVNGRFWVFAGGLTNVFTRVTVTDTETGDVKTYVNPQGIPFQPIQDTSAFGSCAEGSADLAGDLDAARRQAARQLEDTLRGVAAKTTALLLNNARFRVEAEWTTPQGQSGQGEGVMLTSDTGYFWFFNSANVEAVVKVLNGCFINDRYWVFAAGLTDVFTRITVTDTVSGTSKVYENPQSTAFQPILDTGALAVCP